MVYARVLRVENTSFERISLDNVYLKHRANESVICTELKIRIRFPDVFLKKKEKSFFFLLKRRKRNDYDDRLLLQNITFVIC